MESDAKAFRIAATVLVVRDDPFQVLMVRRHAKATFGSRRVFPGGVLEPDDADDAWLPLVTGANGLDTTERALRICAIRETCEETALLIGADVSPETAADVTFRELIASAGIRLPLGQLQPFGHWITPETEARRFDTRFFLAKAPVGQVATADGGETVELEWVEPGAATDDSVMFPTLMNLQRLAESTTADSAIAAASARPVFTVRPVMVLNDDGSASVTIPAEAGYSRTEFVHR